MSIKNKAFRLGATEFGRSKTKDKKYYVVYRGKVINFGQKATKILQSIKTRREDKHIEKDIWQ